MKTVECPRCGARKPVEARYSYKCGSPITIESTVDREKRVEEARKLLEKLYGLLQRHPRAVEGIRGRGILRAPAT